MNCNKKAIHVIFLKKHLTDSNAELRVHDQRGGAAAGQWTDTNGVALYVWMGIGTVVDSQRESGVGGCGRMP